jgi:hypothetical protein
MKRRSSLVRYEVHALRRMEQRGITRSQVNQVLRHPQKTRPAQRPGAKRLEAKLRGNRWLTVIVEETDEFCRVVTAFWR